MPSWGGKDVGTACSQASDQRIEEGVGMKIRTLLLLVLPLAMTVSAYASSQPTVSIGNTTAASLQRVQVPVILTTQGAALATVMMDIKYDASLVSTPAVTLGTAGEGKTLLTNTLPSGALRISLFDLHNTPLRDGTLVNIAVTLASTISRGSAIDLTFDVKSLGASDPSGNDVGLAGVNGAIAVP
jgi:cohesin domain-containing protein